MNTKEHTDWLSGPKPEAYEDAVASTGEAMSARPEYIYNDFPAMSEPASRFVLFSSSEWSQRDYPVDRIVSNH